MAVYTKLADGNDAAKRLARQRLAHWQKDADLVWVRDPPAMDELPEADRQTWRRLWADVDALRKRLSGPK